MPSVGIQILLPDGDPNGIKIIELSGWKGKGFEIPRAKLKDVRNREEVSAPGIYFLFGEGGDDFHKKVYIGESENFYHRLENHDDHKDFWNVALVFTGGLNKAHVKYLENHSIALAKKVDRYEMVNAVETYENRLSEFEKAETEDFFEKIKIVLGILGISLFQESPQKNSTTEIYYLDRVGVQASGTLLDNGEFKVFEGSTARVEEVGSFRGKSGARFRQGLIDEGVLQKRDEKFYIFAKDYIFTSPSAASGAIMAMQSNGWTAWHDKEGKTLDEIKRK
jgi:hypothetical protein